MTTLSWPVNARTWDWDKDRRDRIAIAALQGILSSGNVAGSTEVAQAAVMLADALIAELDKERAP